MSKELNQHQEDYWHIRKPSIWKMFCYIWVIVAYLLGLSFFKEYIVENVLWTLIPFVVTIIGYKIMSTFLP